MQQAYTITYCGPTNTFGARLMMKHPLGRTRFIPRDFVISAPEQAKKLAESTPGFIAFAPLDDSRWIYIASLNASARKAA